MSPAYHAGHHKHIIVGEITKLVQELSESYQFNDSSFPSFGLADIEEEDDFFDHIYQDSCPPTSQITSSIGSSIDSKSSAYLSLKRLELKVDKHLDIATDTYYLLPFCNIIKDENINGSVTTIALRSILKFIRYGFVEASEQLGSAQLIAESVLKTRFPGTHTQNDEKVLEVILAVMRDIIVCGFRTISNEVVCGIMHSSFDIAFDHSHLRLSDNLRRQAKKAIDDMCSVLFGRLAEFKDIPLEYDHEALRIASRSKFLSFNSNSSRNSNVPIQPIQPVQEIIPSSPTVNQVIPTVSSINSSSNEIVPSCTVPIESIDSNSSEAPQPEGGSSTVDNNQGIQFFDDTLNQRPKSNLVGKLFSAIPHDLVCVHGILSHLTQLISPANDVRYNKEILSTGFQLLHTIFSVAVDEIGYKQALLAIIKDELCFNILQFLRFDTPLEFFDSAILLTSLIFPSLRPYLKYQLEFFIKKLMAIVDSDNAPSLYREAASKCLFRFFQNLPYFCNELFINYDCDPFASNLFEDLLKLIDKCCSTVSRVPGSSYTNRGQFTKIQRTSFDLLLTILRSLQKAEFYSNDVIFMYCDHHAQYLVNSDTIVGQGVGVSYDCATLPNSIPEIEKLKSKKESLWKACELFNAKPTEGIKYLQENGLVTSDIDIINFIQDNLRLDKKQIGEYITRKNHRHILKAFVQSFAFKDKRIDEAFRQFQESFRLPGESGLIEPVLEEFSSHWYESNQRPFVNIDAAYSLAYAIIMLNTQQHNISAKKTRGKMTCEEFIKNLRGMNGGQDFDPNLLREIYKEIDSNEIVLPFEHYGVIKDRYLWRCLIRKSVTASASYWFASEKSRFNSNSQTIEPRYELYLNLSVLNEPTFLISWGHILSAMTVIFNQVNVHHNLPLTRSIVNQGFTAGAYLCAKYGHLDDLILSLCKFTKAYSTGSRGFLLTPKSQLAAQCLFYLTKGYANEIRGSWMGIINIIVDWFIAGYLDDLFEFEDFVLGKKISLKRQRTPKSSKLQQDNSSSLFTSLVSYLAGSTQDNLIDDFHDCYSSNNSSRDPQDCSCYSQTQNLVVNICKPLTIIEEAKVLHPDPLVELIKALINLDLEMEDEVGDDVEAFRLEMLVSVVLTNIDRSTYFWRLVLDHLISAAEKCSLSEFFAERYTSAVFRIGTRFLQKQDASDEKIFRLIQNITRTNAAETCALKLLSVMLDLHMNSDITAASNYSEYLCSNFEEFVKRTLTFV